MSYIFTALVFLIIFSILILVHEFGHFIMAKRAGIKVEEFGFGLPPRLWGKKKGETIYSINWIPFGGFVRMYGEDQADPKMLKSSRSFAAKPMRARVKVVVAGVVMNFLLAWILMIVGFTVGMQPTFGPNDLLPAVSRGDILVEAGAKIQNIQAGGLAEMVGMKNDDVLISFNNKQINAFVLAEVFKNPVGTYQVERNDQIWNFEIEDKMVEAGDITKPLGVELYEALPLPRVRIFDIKASSLSYKAGLRPNDVVISVNGEQVYSVLDYESIIRGQKVLDYILLRNGLLENFIVERPLAQQVLATDILPNSPAEKVGLESGDIILAINNQEMSESSKVIEFIELHQTENLAFLIERKGQRLFYEIKPENARIGVLLSNLMNYADQQDVSLYNVDLLTSVTEIKDEKYPFHIATYKALGETWKLSKMTANMFVGFVGNLVSTGEVPESVAGPVGIAQLTHVFIQEGFIPLLKFVAILSLSLAVINILPFPALDGGRLLFIVIEFIFGRKVNQKWESWIHAFGYLLILLLIVAVTYSDIMKLL